MLTDFVSFSKLTAGGLQVGPNLEWIHSKTDERCWKQSGYMRPFAEGNMVQQSGYLVPVAEGSVVQNEVYSMKWALPQLLSHYEILLATWNACCLNSLPHSLFWEKSKLWGDGFCEATSTSTEQGRPGRPHFAARHWQRTNATRRTAHIVY